MERINLKYRRSGFDCVVKRLRMALYKPDCDFNDCELPSGQYIINCVYMYILFPAILLIASYGKTRNSQSKESRNQNPTYGITS